MNRPLPRNGGLARLGWLILGWLGWGAAWPWLVVGAAFSRASKAAFARSMGER